MINEHGEEVLYVAVQDGHWFYVMDEYNGDCGWQFILISPKAAATAFKLGIPVTNALPWKSTSEANSRSGRNETRSMTPQPKANAVKPAHRSPPRVVLEFFFQLARENLAKRRIRAAGPPSQDRPAVNSNHLKSHRNALRKTSFPLFSTTAPCPMMI